MDSLIVFEWNGLLLSAAAAVCVFLVLMPGLACSVLIRSGDAWDRSVFALVFSSLLGYGAFWMYLAHPLAGKCYTVIIFVASLAVLVRRVIAGGRTFVGSLLGTGIGVQMAVVVIYVAILNLSPFAGSQTDLANEYFFPQWGDNAFQGAVVERLFQGQSVRQFDGWPILLERPPLQAGLILLSGAPFISTDIWVEAAGVAVNSSWVLVLLWLGHRLGLDGRAVGRVLVLAVFVGFFFNSTVFTWPKMLAGTLVLIGASLWWFSGRDRIDPVRFLLGAGAWSCAWVAHPTSGFSILLALVCGTVLLARIARSADRVPWATLLSASLLVGWIVVPWSVYQNVLGGPSDVLLKHHLGGAFSATSDQSAIAVLLAGYGDSSFSEIVSRKAMNLKALIWPLGDYGEGAISWRRADYYHVLHALGVLNIGWLVWLRSRLGGGEKSSGLSGIAAPFFGAWLILGFWIVLEFGPTQAEVVHWVHQSFNPPISLTISHQGSYAPYVLLVLVCSALLQRLSTLWWRTVLVGHLSLFAWFYVITPRGLFTETPLEIGALIALVVGLLGLTYFRSQLASSSSDIDEPASVS